jgi:hypothetical protein
MALLYMHYLVGAFFVSVWIQRPFVTITLGYLFQSIYYALWETEVSDVYDFIFYQPLLVILGATLGAVFLYVYNAPETLPFTLDASTRWLKVSLMLAVLFACHIPYELYDHPWGLILTMIATLVVIGVSYVAFSRECIWLSHREGLLFFAYWAIYHCLMLTGFFFVSVWDEKWLAFAIGGVIGVALIVMEFVMQRGSSSSCNSGCGSVKKSSSCTNERGMYQCADNSNF